MRGILTGASGKIGRRLAQAIVQRQWPFVFQVHRAEGRLQSLMGGAQSIVVADLRRADGRARLIAHAVERLGAIDAFIHCASIFERVPFEAVTEEEWDAVHALDLKAPFFLIQALVKRAEKMRIILFSDAIAQIPPGREIHYGAAKAGVASLARGLAKHLRNASIHAIAPQRLETAEDYAKVVEQVMRLLTD